MRIVQYPHPALRHVSKPLRRVDAELREIVREMFHLMYEANGIGLAANQVDLPYRLFVLNLKSDPEAADQEQVFLNPVIMGRKGGMAESEEGCLSLPGLYAQVKRPEKVVLNAFNLAGEEVNLDLEGLFARAVQHEIDHLDGILFIDRLSPTGELAVKRRSQISRPSSSASASGAKSPRTTPSPIAWPSSKGCAPDRRHRASEAQERCRHEKRVLLVQAPVAVPRQILREVHDHDVNRHQRQHRQPA